MSDGLDPADWDEIRRLGHRMLDDMIGHMASVRDRPVWQRMPDSLRGELRDGLPRAEEPAEDAYATLQRLVIPYTTGNLHPRFMGWVHGGGNPVGMLAEMMAAGLNANLGGRDHAPIEVERQVIRWAAEMTGLPRESSGVFVTGSSLANFIAVLVARRAALGRDVRRAGLEGRPLVAYAALSAHGCVARALDMCGLGTDALRLIPCEPGKSMDMGALTDAIRADREIGALPFLAVGTAGTVDTGAVDDLAALAAICRREQLWFHVDGAFGALAMLSPRYSPLLRGIEQADSLALDFHKWAQVPYDAGCIVVRDPRRQLDTFAQDLSYLRREERGLAGGHPWPCDLGPDLSRGFRALKVWMTLKTYGADRLGAVVERSCAVAQHIAARVATEPELELLAPVTLNIACFRFRDAVDPDTLNRDIVGDLHESGIAAPSTTQIGGALAIRAAIVNHRTVTRDADLMLDAVLRFGRQRVTSRRRMPGA